MLYFIIKAAVVAAIIAGVLTFIFGLTGRTKMYETFFRVTAAFVVIAVMSTGAIHKICAINVETHTETVCERKLISHADYHVLMGEPELATSVDDYYLAEMLDGKTYYQAFYIGNDGEAKKMDVYLDMGRHIQTKVELGEEPSFKATKTEKTVNLTDFEEWLLGKNVDFSWWEAKSYEVTFYVPDMGDVRNFT